MKNTTKISIFILSLGIIFAAFSVSAQYYYGNLNVSCYANQNPIQENQTVSFFANVSGGSGNYTYSWSGDCYGSSWQCIKTFNADGNYTTTVYVYSSGQSGTASCSVNVQKACVQNYEKKCYGPAVYWYDSCGYRGELVKNCASGQGCQNGECINPQTPQTPDAPQTNCGNGLCEQGENSSNCVQDCPLISEVGSFAISAFGKNDRDGLQWGKNVSVAANEKIDFLIVVKNTSNANINDVVLKTELPVEVGSVSDIKIDGVATEGDILQGLNVGAISPLASLSVTFQGTLLPSVTAGTKQVTAIVSAENLSDMDGFVLNIAESQGSEAAASVSGSGFSFKGFLERWYLWILIAVVLVFLFIIVFRRLSSE